MEIASVCLIGSLVFWALINSCEVNMLSEHRESIKHLVNDCKAAITINQKCFYRNSQGYVILHFDDKSNILSEMGEEKFENVDAALERFIDVARV